MPRMRYLRRTSIVGAKDLLSTEEGLTRMFGYLRKRKVKNLLGAALHEQLKKAFEEDEAATSSNLRSSFTLGYVTGFISFGFTSFGYNSLIETPKQIISITWGVHPQLPKELDLVKELQNLRANIGDKYSAKLDEEGLIGADLYNLALQAGIEDCGELIRNDLTPSLWQRWLTTRAIPHFEGEE
jgi:hypothetical protein